MDFSRIRMIGTLAAMLHQMAGAEGSRYALWGDGTNFSCKFPMKDGAELEANVAFGRESSWRVAAGNAVIGEGRAETGDADDLLEIIWKEIEGKAMAICFAGKTPEGSALAVNGLKGDEKAKDDL